MQESVGAYADVEQLSARAASASSFTDEQLAAATKVIEAEIARVFERNRAPNA